MHLPPISPGLLDGQQRPIDSMSSVSVLRFFLKKAQTFLGNPFHRWDSFELTSYYFDLLQCRFYHVNSTMQSLRSEELLTRTLSETLLADQR